MNFEEVYKINVNEHTEKKNNLTYLSWAWAWAEFKKAYPDAEYEIKRFENGLPYVYDENTGYMVFTSVTAGDLTYEMWLPVMDGANKAMKKDPYTYMTKYGEKTVDSATMFDVNKTIMRCLVKNLAMFGLGLYIYAGEDLPESNENEIRATITEIVEKSIKEEIKKAKISNETVIEALKKFNITKLCELKTNDLMEFRKSLNLN